MPAQQIPRPVCALAARPVTVQNLHVRRRIPTASAGKASSSPRPSAAGAREARRPTYDGDGFLRMITAQPSDDHLHADARISRRMLGVFASRATKKGSEGFFCRLGQMQLAGCRVLRRRGRVSLVPWAGTSAGGGMRGISSSGESVGSGAAYESAPRHEL